MSRTSKALYKPLSLVTGVLGGVLAGYAFREVWRRVGDDDVNAPLPEDLSRSTKEVLIAAVLQGAVFGLVKAAVDRAGAKSYRAITHESPM